MIQACLNGERTPQEHPAIPRTPDELARDGRAAVEAGAQLLHLHPYDKSGRQTFEAKACAAALRAVRASCPGIPISMTTLDAVEGHPQRLRSIARWKELPDLVTANQGEEGIVELCELLTERGIGIEAGLLQVDDALRFVDEKRADRLHFARILIEPLDEDPIAAVRHAAAMEQVLDDAGVTLEQVHHGDGVATWHVMARALSRGHGVRAGLEDTTKLPDGRLAPDNASLVALALGMAEGGTAFDFEGEPGD